MMLLGLPKHAIKCHCCVRRLTWLQGASSGRRTYRPVLRVHCRSYMRTMRHKLGLLQLECDSDEQLVQDLLQVRSQVCLITVILSQQAFSDWVQRC